MGEDSTASGLLSIIFLLLLPISAILGDFFRPGIIPEWIMLLSWTLVGLAILITVIIVVAVLLAAAVAKRRF